MGLFDNFFGGAKTKTKTYSNWNTEQQKAFNTIAPQIVAGASGPAPSSPNAYVPTTDAEQQYLNWAKSEAVKNMATGQVPYEVGPEYANQYFENSIRPIMQREWKDTTLPGIQEQYAGSTFNSTGRDYAVTKATERYGQDLAAKKSELIYNEELAKRKAIESAYGRVGQGQQLAQAAGQYTRAIETEKVMDSLRRFLMGEEVNGQSSAAYNPMITQAFNLLGLQPFSYGTQATGAGIGYQALSSWAKSSGQFFGGGMFSGGTPAAEPGSSAQAPGKYYEQTSGNDPYVGWNGGGNNSTGLFQNAAALLQGGGSGAAADDAYLAMMGM